MKLTREALSTLFQMEDPTSGEMLPPLRAEDIAVTELAADLMAAAQATYGDGVAPLTLTTAIAALEAGRYRPGEEGWPSVSAALKCLYKCQNKELWQAECEQIAELTGLELMDARAFWKRASDTSTAPSGSAASSVTGT